MNYFFPIHLDAGNRGCEGIARGTANILNQPKENMISLCNNIDLDVELGLNQFYTLQTGKKISVAFNYKNGIYHKISRLLNKDEYFKKQYYWRYKYGHFLNQMRTGDVMISTGGDMMCYTNNEVLFTNNYLHKKPVKTILWGCSMGKENLTDEKLDSLKNFDLVYARESITSDFFQELGLKKVICYPDPAFILEPKIIDLPNSFRNSEVLGLNISNFVLGDFSLNTKFGEQLIKLIDYLIKETDYHILLIPHVTWLGQDDRVIANLIYNHYCTDRISILDIDHLSYCQIRYVISKCKFFIGGRTHAVISAYSTCVPTIALGYSIKSKGIARDLGIDEKYVVDSKNQDNPNNLLEIFIDLQSNEKNFKQHLIDIIPSYRGTLSNLNNSMINTILDQ